MRCHAVVMASTYGQVAWIFGHLCVGRAPVGPRRPAPALLAERLRLGPGQVAVQSQQDLPGHRGVSLAALTAKSDRWEVAQADVLDRACTRWATSM